MLDSDIFESIDFNSSQPKFYFKGRRRFVTVIGVIMSILSIMTIIFMSFFFFMSYIEAREINLIFYNIKVNSPSYSDLEGMPFFFRIYDFTNDSTIDPRIASIVPVQFEFRNNSFVASRIMDTEPCNWEKHLNKSKYDATIPNIANLKDFQCVDPKKYNLKLIEDTLKGDSIYYNIYASTCRNTSQNNNSCYSPEIIEAELLNKNIYLEYYIPSITVDHMNYSFPVQASYYDTSLRIDYNFKYTIYENMGIMNYTSDIGFVFEEMKTVQSLIRLGKEINIFSKSTKYWLKTSFATLQFGFRPNYLEIYKRTFTKIQQIIANIGGVMKIIMFSANFITNFFTEKFMHLFLINENLEYEREEIANKISNKSVASFSKSINPVPKYFRKQKTLNRKEIIYSTFSCKNNSKRVLENGTKNIKLCLSSNNFIKKFNEFDRMKKIIFDEDQLILFSYTPNEKLKYQEKVMNISNFNDLEINHLFLKLSTRPSQDYINERLLNLWKLNTENRENKIIQEN